MDVERSVEGDPRRPEGAAGIPDAPVLEGWLLTGSSGGSHSGSLSGSLSGSFGAARTVEAAVRRPGYRLLRFGTAPLFVALDVLAVLLGLGFGWIVDGRLDRTAVAFGVVVLVSIATSTLYRSRLVLSLLDDLPLIGGRWLLALAVTMLLDVVPLLSAGVPARMDWPALRSAVAVLFLLLTLRGAGYAVVRSARAQGIVVHRTVVVGTGRVAHELVTSLRRHPEYGLHPLGFVSESGADDRELPLPVLGCVAELEAVLRDFRIDNVVVADARTTPDELSGLLRAATRQRCAGFVVPRLQDAYSGTAATDTVAGIPLVRLAAVHERPVAQLGKRTLDVLVAGALFVLLSPALLVAAAALRLENGAGRVLSRHARIGIDGRPFSLLAFRSRRPDGSVGPIGRFLRRTSLTGVPVLLSVLRGDLSLVGPRAQRSSTADALPLPALVHAGRRIPSGITGYAQVHGVRRATSTADRARYDRYYIENWSLWLDVKILLLSGVELLRGT